MKLQYLLRQGLTLLGLGLGFNPSPVLSNELFSHYMSLNPDNCTNVAPTLQTHYHARGLNALACPTLLPALTLVVVNAGERSWLDVVLDNVLWSTETAFINTPAYQFGYFPHLGTSPAELILDSAQHPLGIIIRLYAEDPEREPHGVTNTSRLFVLKLKAHEVCLLGFATQNEQARQQLTNGQACQQRLTELIHLTP